MTSEVSRSQFGIENMERFVERTFWISGAFTVANALAVTLFSGQSLSNRIAFSVMHAGAINYFFEGRFVETWVDDLKNLFDNSQAHKVFDYARFFFITLGPIVVARIVTTGLFQPLTFKEGFQISAFNYLFSLICLPVCKNGFN